MKRIFIFSLFAFGLTAQYTAFAQQKLPEIQNLDSIIIQNQRLQIPFSEQNRNITVLDRAVIQSMPVRSINELLSYVAGIDVRRRGVYGTQADIGINGGTFDQTLILLNGVKVIDPQTGHNMMNLPVSLGAIQRIEILKGAAASAYGINALNGAINIITRQPEKTGVSAHIYTGSSFRKDTATGRLYTGLGIEASGSLVKKNTSHFLSLSTIQSNGYRHNTPVNNNKIFYSNNIRLGKNSIGMMGGFIYNDFGANGFYAAPQDKESREIVQTAIAAIDADLRITDFWTMRPAFSYRYSFDDYIFVRDHPEMYENRHYTNVTDATLNNSFYTSAGTFGLGLEYRNANINSSNLGEHERSNFGFFGAYSLDFIPKTLINIGLYANYSDDFGWDWMPSIDAGYRIYRNFRIFASAGTGLRLPTYTDWYYKGPVNIGNDELQPERSWQTTAGIKYNNAGLNASASYFYRNTSDFIDWVKDSLSDPWQPRNFQNIKTRGISLSADYRVIGQDKASGYSLLMGLSYTWLHPDVAKGEKAGESATISHYALENLRNQLATRIHMKLFHHFGLTLSGKYQQRVNYKDYFLLAAGLSANIQKFKIYFDATNLTDVRFIEAGAVPMPGSWFTLGVKWQWWKK